MSEKRVDPANSTANPSTDIISYPVFLEGAKIEEFAKVVPSQFKRA
jgi:hypothetical protein